jgi:hypothetical protein
MGANFDSGVHKVNLSVSLSQRNSLVTKVLNINYAVYWRYVLEYKRVDKKRASFLSRLGNLMVTPSLSFFDYQIKYFSIKSFIQGGYL